MSSIGIDVTETTADMKYNLGQIYEQKSALGFKKKWRYVKYDTNATITGAVGVVCYFLVSSGLPTGIVDSDVSDSSPNLFAGVMTTAIAKGSYGWVQFAGPIATMNIYLATGSAIAVGTPAIGHGTSDGKAGHVVAGTAPTYLPLGTYTAAKTHGNTSAPAILGMWGAAA